MKTCMREEEKVKRIIKEEEIKWVQLHLTDLIGGLRILHLSSDEFITGVMRNGCNFDGSSIGFVGVEKSDLIALPDMKTFLKLPHENDEARVIANVYDTRLKPFPACPRQILLKAVNKLKRQGFTHIKVSPEMEFYVIKEVNENYTNKNRYFAPPPIDESKDYRKRLSAALIESGYHVKYHHHEVGRTQHEIEIRELDAIEAADFCMYFKYLSKEIAQLYNFLVTFMPKPFSDDAGNGMHMHIKLFKGNKNIFYDENDDYRLSQIARYFIGGVLEHAKGIAAIANPTINSYKRFVPGFEAPCYITWGRYNRSGLIRIPAKKDADIEVRGADPAANPYLLYAAIIYAGIDGIKKKIEYEPLEKNVYLMDEREVKKRKIRKLPSTLQEAIEELLNDEVLVSSLGKTVIEMFVEKKKKEIEKYSREITDLDYELYFDC